MTKKMNQPVLIYGAGYRGRMNLHILEDENIPVLGFADRDADQIPLYCGKPVFTGGVSVEQYGDHPFIVSIDDEKARNTVLDFLRNNHVEAYVSVNDYYTGAVQQERDTVLCGTKAAFPIIPSMLDKNEKVVCFSFGIGYDDSFERELIEKYGVEVFAFDPSPEVVRAMEGQVLPTGYHYFPYALSDVDEKKTFYRPSSGQDYSEYFASWTSNIQITMQCHRLKTLMDMMGMKRIDILKMDIEGSEFMALPDILNSHVLFDQLCIETHARIFPNSVEKMAWLKRQLNEAGYELVVNGIEEQLYCRTEAIVSINE